MDSVNFTGLYNIVRRFNSKKETLPFKDKKVIMCCSNLIRRHVERVDLLLNRKKLSLDDYDIMALKKYDKLFVFCSLQNIYLSYSMVFKKLLIFKDVCDKYKCKDEHIEILMEIKSEVTDVMGKVFEQLTFLSDKMIILIDKNNFKSRSIVNMDTTIDFEQLKKDVKEEERLEEFIRMIIEDPDSSSDDNNDKDDKGATSNKVKDDSEFSIIENDHSKQLEKPVNEENSFENSFENGN